MAIAGQPRQHTDQKPGLKCVVTTDRQTIRDPKNYLGAYESGYRQGTEDRVRSATSRLPSSDGEMARGYTDGFQLKPYSGQTTTVPTQNQVTCGCRTYILKNVIFREEVEAVCKSDRDEIASVKSDAYNPNAYADG